MLLTFKSFPSSWQTEVNLFWWSGTGPIQFGHPTPTPTPCRGAEEPLGLGGTLLANHEVSDLTFFSTDLFAISSLTELLAVQPGLAAWSSADCYCWVPTTPSFEWSECNMSGAGGIPQVSLQGKKLDHTQLRGMPGSLDVPDRPGKFL